VNVTSGTWFIPVVRATGERGGYLPEQLDQALRTWVTSPPLRTLAAASSWDWPADETTTLGLLQRLARLSADWDFRNNRERRFIEPRPAIVNGQQLSDSLVIDAARDLGLVEPAPVTGREPSHLIVLSGQAWACVSRTRYAAELLRSGLRPGAIIVLGAHRKLDDEESAQAEEAGLGYLTDEAEVILAATRQAFRLGPPLSAEEPQPAPDPEQPAVFHAACARYQWPSVEVVIAPSDTPAVRRAKTGDQLHYWADLAGPDQQHDVLIVTTPINVPYQHLVAARILGLGRGCAVYSCGADGGSPPLSGRPLAGRDYLQEIRAALRAGVRLLGQAHGTPIEPG
jgi:hypothetical protein